jgi:branched-chain amino acid transport system permease protein
VSERLRRISPLVPLGAILVLVPLVAGGAYNLSSYTGFCIDLILLTGLNLIAGYGRQISLAQAGFYGLGAYAAGVCVAKTGIPAWLAFLAAPAVAAAVAVVIGVPSLRLKGLYFTMATLGVGVVLFLVFERATSVTGGPNGLLGITALEVGGFAFEDPLAVYALAAVLAFTGMAAGRNLMRSRFGWGLQASGVSEPGAAAAGVATFRIRLAVFVVSAAYAGVAGALETFDSRFISPASFDFFAAVLLFVALMIGGLGTFWGPFVGAFVLFAFDRWLTSLSDAEPLILGVVFLVAVQLFPRGIVGSLEEWWRDRSAAAAPEDDDGAVLPLAAATGAGEVAP